MSQLRLIQITALVLFLIAGVLWSQRLADQQFQASQAKIDQSVTDQIGLVQKKVNEKDDPVELFEFGRKFLETGNARYAIVALERAVKLKSDFRDAWYLLGYSYTKLATDLNRPTDATERQINLDKALAALNQAHAIDPNHHPTNDLIQQLR